MDQKIPLSRELSGLEENLRAVRAEYEDVRRTLDTRNLDLNNLREELKARRDEKNYLANLLGEYARNYETQLHIAELQRYEEVVEDARLAPENSNLSPGEQFDDQYALVASSVMRLEAMLGGTRYPGTAAGDGGLVVEGTFAQIGPAAYFSADESDLAGLAEQRLGSMQPTVLGFEDAAMVEMARTLVESGNGQMPFDPTQGNAHKIEQTRQTVWEHIRKGGVVMFPILGLAAAALLVALVKWVQLARVPVPDDRKIEPLLRALGHRDVAQAKGQLAKIRGPVSEMLAAGVDHLNESKERIEEGMFEKVLQARLKLHRALPFIAVTAACAPLLGLLGTVTGIINTFKLITVFGSGDVKMLSGGISEALITTEFGLIIAIPSLLLHAFLARKAKSIVDRMEKVAVSALNQISRRNTDASAHAGGGAS